MSITKPLLATDWWSLGNRCPKDESPIGDPNPVPLLTLPFSVGLIAVQLVPNLLEALRQCVKQRRLGLHIEPRQ